MPAVRKNKKSQSQLYSSDDILSVLNDDDVENEIITKKKPSKNAKTKGKRKPISIERDSSESSSSTLESYESPPKQTKFESKTDASKNISPSRLIDKLNIDDDHKERKDKKKTKNEIQIIKNKYQNAKISLACTETINLPGRENEMEILYNFLMEHLNTSKSGSLYVSGQPGTGKTACLSTILKDENFINNFIKLYINCTSVTTIGSIYKKICAELKISGVKTEKECLKSIETKITGSRKMILMVLDEIDQLVGKKQSVLYSIFEWPSIPNAKIIIIGIANSLDLTDRLLSRLNSKCDLKPKLLHFPPYTKQQIIDIFKSRLENASVSDIFPVATIQLLAAKVAAISGDVRKALDIGRRVIEIAEQRKYDNISSIINDIDINGITILNEKDCNIDIQPIQIKQVADVLNNVYGASQKFHEDISDAFPLQQKILICTLMLMLHKGKNKDITIGRLHDVYKRVCQKRNIQSIDQAEFVSICSLVETRGIIRLAMKKEPRFSRIFLQWDDEEVTLAIKDKQLISSILDDVSCLGK